MKMSDCKLVAFRDKNREKCQGSKLMPTFSPKMQYSCLTKTHFVHAHKLGKDGTRILFGEGKVPIRWRPDDTEGQLISEQGLLCVVYGCELLDDKEALSSVTGDDNLNAGVQMAEDEMQAFGRVHYLFEAMAPSQPQASSVGSSPIDPDKVFEKCARLAWGISRTSNGCALSICAASCFRVRLLSSKPFSSKQQPAEE